MATSALSAGASEERFQAYLFNQVTDWIKKGSKFRAGQSLNFAATTAPMIAGDGFNVAMSVAPRQVRAGFQQGTLPYQMSLRIAGGDDRFALRIGDGDGAIDLGGAVGFSHASDYDPARGGANPLLGMASGDGFVQASYALNETLAVSAGFTGNDTRYDRRMIPALDRAAYLGLYGYRTSAGTVSLRWRPDAALELTGSYTRLNEEDAILGIQAIDPQLLGKGSNTAGYTLNAAWSVSPTLNIAASGTVGRTDSAARNALISTGAGGFKSSAWQVTAAKRGLLDRADSLRVSLAQPLHVSGGALRITSVQVIDRETGALGNVTEEFGIATKKTPLIGNLAYGRALMDGKAELALFGRAQLAGEPTVEGDAKFMGGLRFSMRY